MVAHLNTACLHLVGSSSTAPSASLLATPIPRPTSPPGIAGGLGGKTDSWDVAAGLVAGHQQFPQRIAHLGAALLAALDGDERAGDRWGLEQMSGPQRDQDIAESSTSQSMSCGSG